MLAGTITGDDIIEICEQLAGEIDDVIFSPFTKKEKRYTFKKLNSTPSQGHNKKKMYYLIGLFNPLGDS